MRYFPGLLACITALLLAAAPLIHGEEPSPAKPTVIDVPDGISSAVIDGDVLYGLTSKNELLRVDLPGRKVKTLVGFPAETKVQTLTVADGKACVGGRDEKGAVAFYVVDLTAEKVTHTLKADPAGSARTGFVMGDWIYAVNGLDVQIYKASDGKWEKTIKVGGGVLADSYRVGDRLYLAREYGGALGVIDMKEAKLLDLIETKDWLFQVRVGKDKAFVFGGFTGLGAIDLKTRQYAAIERPEGAKEHDPLTLQVGPDRGFLVYNGTSSVVYQYNSAVKIVGHTPIDKSAGKFVGAWNGDAVFASGKGATLIPLTKPQKEKD